ncbi:MAG: molybdopterin-dependent oxidoreductase [Chloroflexota bacterium]
MSAKETKTTPTSTHWGNFRVEVNEAEEIVGVHPYEADLEPSPFGQALKDALDTRVRVSQPMVREGYLKAGANSDKTGRGREPFVAVSWETAFDLVAAELQRVIATHGNEAIYAGSYGWSSPGTLHIARWNMHRLLNLVGGFTDSIGSYSTAAYEAITPHVLASNGQLVYDTPAWSDIAENAELVVLFGGAALKNSQVSFGGLGPHVAKHDMETAVRNGVEFVNISPIREDLDDFEAEWLAPRPNTDTAIMLGIAHTLITENLVDTAYIDKYTVGYEKFVPYVLGETDGEPKTADWAAAISEIPANTIRILARRMAARKTMIGVNWAIQRAQHGEQPYWMAIVLAAMLGEIGHSGRGIALGLNAMHSIGSSKRPLVGWPERPKGTNSIRRRIPVARIADMLLNPGQPFQFNGNDWTFPNIRLVYWVGGNPFHHHQDIHRLIRAWQQPDTIIVNEPFWTATARYSDIVLPATTVLERNDINFTLLGASITPMRQAVSPYAQARSDYDIFLGLAERLNVVEAYSEGRNEMDWLRHFYEEARGLAKDAGRTLPDFESFWLGDQLTIERDERHTPLVEKFYANPTDNPLPTSSGKIEIFSETIASFGYDDCQGHPKWLPTQEWLGAEKAAKYPLHLLSNQPKTRLHSQLDHARTSQIGKIKGREPARMNPQDATARGIVDGDYIRLFNERGACLSVVVLSDDLRPGVIQLPTGAWFNPADPNQPNSLEIHGNPNVLTLDVGTSKLGQGPSPNSALVEVEKYSGAMPGLTVHTEPSIVRGENGH